MEIHENIKLLREKRGETLEEVAKAIGSSKQTIQRYETGEIKNIPYDKIVALAKHFRVKPGAIMGWEDTEDITDNMVEEHIELISLFEQLNDTQKTTILDMMKWIIKNEKGE